MRFLYVVAAVAVYSINVFWNWSTFNRRSLVLERYRAVLVTLPRPEVLKIADLGFDALAADWYWIKGINYFGDARNAQVAYGELYNYFDLVTNLDPRFYPAYLFGGYALPWNTGRGWVNTAQAAKLLEKGVAQFPDDYRLRMQLAYIYSSFMSRYADAGQQLSVAAKLPGAPSYLGPLATRMYATAGDLTTAQALAEHLFEQTRDPKERALIRERYLELKSASLADALTKGAEAFHTAQGRYPRSLEELASTGVPVPPEPLGGEWKYDPHTGKVASSVLKSRVTIYVDPRDNPHP